ncbi:MAG: DUF1343 domain-containing protein [Bacteroidetes bacterium]|nr:DUF1343 domain-containing protein [Bacteroidota bacterium]MBL7104199.1 DUF1343 domain-containing protein [Bacteroidales bacterium]
MKNYNNIHPAPLSCGRPAVEGGVHPWFFISVIVILLLLNSCSNAQQKNYQDQNEDSETKIVVGAERTELYFPLLKDKWIAIVANQTSLTGNDHLVDSLVYAGFNVVKVFSPEHGFRGSAGAGEEVSNNVDAKTGIPVISLYGKKKKPSPEDLSDVDIVIFDIQDVGARFYTYISTMTYVMEACAENNVEFIILDRPNPNGDYVDGPVLEKKFKTFVGLHPVPIVHGMTVGEYAQMVNGEGWLKDGIKCKLIVVPVENYDHKTQYDLPIPPSPNLPNNTAIQLYPSLCFFEGTIISVGRGTEFPFQVIGHPDFMIGSFVFEPKEIPGVAKNPKYEGQKCYGQSLQGFAENVLMESRQLRLSWLISMHEFFKDRNDFFTPYFEKLSGTEKLRKQIIEGKSEEEIRKSWEKDLTEFKNIRKKYLLYEDFE